jgi:hypothetical protein
VAEALLTKTKLSGKQVDKLAGRSVDDVKVNAPFLLAMSRDSDSARGNPTQPQPPQHTYDVKRPCAGSERPNRNVTGSFSWSGRYGRAKYNLEVRRTSESRAKVLVQEGLFGSG